MFLYHSKATLNLAGFLLSGSQTRLCPQVIAGHRSLWLIPHLCK